MMRFGALAARWGSLRAAALVAAGAVTSCNDGSGGDRGVDASTSSQRAPREDGAGGAPRRPADVPAPSDHTAGYDGDLLPEDHTFVDPRDGWGWSDRCWRSLQAGQLAAARARCAAGLRVAPVASGADTGGARPSLLYNLGLVEERRGNLIAARRLFAESLALRRHGDVEAALRRVGGLACDPCSTQEEFDAAHRRGTVCCPVIGCVGDADCPAGRVCCRIPDGQLCGDAPRCSPEQRVEPPP